MSPDNGGLRRSASDGQLSCSAHRIDAQLCRPPPVADATCSPDLIEDMGHDEAVAADPSLLALPSNRHASHHWEHAAKSIANEPNECFSRQSVDSASTPSSNRSSDTSLQEPGGSVLAVPEHSPRSVERLVERLHRENGVPLEDLRLLHEQGVLQKIPRTREGRLRSVGSILHASHQCRPCLFWFRRCCINGIHCEYCHFEHSPARHRRIRPSKNARQQMRILAKQNH